MQFEIDVSGEDLLSKDYTICVANDKIIKGFKFSEELIKILSSRYGQGFYKYKKSSKQKTIFKLRIYSIVIYKIIASINVKGNLDLKICRDFDGKEEEIKNNLKFLLGNLLNFDLSFEFTKLGKDSPAHNYAYLMRKDKNNQLKTYVKISLEEIEEFLKK